MNKQPGSFNINYRRLLTVLSILPLVFLVNNLLGFSIVRFFDVRERFVYFVIASLAQFIMLIVATLYLSLAKWKLSINDLGLTPARLPMGVKQGFVNGPLIFILVSLGGFLVNLLHPFPENVQPFAEMVLNSDSVPKLVFLGLLGVILAPLAEELYFRGLLYPVLRDCAGIWGGIILSGLVFGLLHLDIMRLVPLAVGGMALAWLYEKTGSLYASITAHGVWNGLMLLIMLLSQKA